MKRTREEEEEPSGKKVKVECKNKLLNPRSYDDWEETDRSDDWVCYESSRLLGIPIYSETPKEEGMQTSIVSKKEKVLRIKSNATSPLSFDGKIEWSASLSKEYPEAVRTTIQRLVKDVIAACSSSPEKLHPHLHVREVIQDLEEEIHYLYVIEYEQSDPSMTLTLPLLLPSSESSPCAKSMSLLSMIDGKMTFTFCA